MTLQPDIIGQLADAARLRPPGIIFTIFASLLIGLVALVDAQRVNQLGHRELSWRKFTFGLGFVFFAMFLLFKHHIITPDDFVFLRHD